MDRSRHRRDRENPSFSSTLLDEIYRSIDEGGAGEEELILYRETMRKKQSNYGGVKHDRSCFDEDDDEEMTGVRRACMIGKWMEKKVSEKVVVRRKTSTTETAVDFERKSRSDRGGAVFLNSSSSSSDSSCGGGFSSSEAEIETVYGVPSSKSSGGGYTSQRPKPIRTNVSIPPEKFNVFDTYNHHENRYVSEQKTKHEGGFVKTKSRALKIYGDLKKVKQPISPGGKLANFLNSLFTAGNAKKAKISSSVVGGYDDMMRSDRKVSKSTTDSAHGSTTCSSASSFSRSCLSKTPSSRGKSSNGMKRSVRFYPVSVIVDEDSQPCGHKSLYEEDEQSHIQAVKSIRNTINEQLQFQIMEKHRRVEEAARDLLRNYQKKVECEFDLRTVHNNNNNSNNNNNVKFNNDHHEDDDDDDDDEDDDDAASYASSDLFELDNLSAIGIDRYREELPVYETTHLNTNRAIANGLIM